jgi:hypothetical protein
VPRWWWRCMLTIWRHTHMLWKSVAMMMLYNRVVHVNGISVTQQHRRRLVMLLLAPALYWSSLSSRE